MIVTCKIDGEVVDKEFNSEEEMREFINTMDPQYIIGVHNEELNNC